MIYGEAETGKSTIALQCAMNCAVQGYKTLYIDCDGMFSAKRLSQIAAAKFGSIAELVILMKPSDFREQTFVLDQLAHYLTTSFGLVIVDTVTSLYSAEIAQSPEKAFELNRELNKQLASVAQSSKIHKVTVLMLSQVRTAFKEQHVSIEPVATRVLKFWADTIICMKPTEDRRIVKAVLEKSPAEAYPSTCYLKVEESGLHDCSK